MQWFLGGKSSQQVGTVGHSCSAQWDLAPKVPRAAGTQALDEALIGFTRSKGGAAKIRPVISKGLPIHCKLLRQRHRCAPSHTWVSPAELQVWESLPFSPLQRHVGGFRTASAIIPGREMPQCSFPLPGVHLPGTTKLSQELWQKPMEKPGLGAPRVPCSCFAAVGKEGGLACRFQVHLVPDSMPGWAGDKLVPLTDFGSPGGCG